MFSSIGNLKLGQSKGFHTEGKITAFVIKRIILT